VPDKRPLSGNLVGLNAFSEQWTAICKRLIATKTEELNKLSKKERDADGLPSPPNFEFAPQGPFREIVTIETGSAFATIAKRDRDFGYFSPPDFEKAVLEGELIPFGIAIEDLSDDGRDRNLKRHRMSISRLMKTFVFFGLFVSFKTTHKLTPLGVQVYEELSSDADEEDPAVVGAGCGLQFMGRYSGVGTARGGHTQVTLHRYY